MIDLREVDVRVAVVDDGVEELQRVPDAMPLPVARQVVGLLREHEVERLVRVVEAVELLHRVARLGGEVPELLRGFPDGALHALECNT